MRKPTSGFPKQLSLWIHVAAILLGIGINYGVMKSESAELQRRVAELEKDNPAQMHWQLDKNTENIDRLASDQKSTAASIGALQAKIDVMATKVDYIAEALKHP